MWREIVRLNAWLERRLLEDVPLQFKHPPKAARTPAQKDVAQGSEDHLPEPSDLPSKKKQKLFENLATAL